MENTWAKALGEGKEVKVNIQHRILGIVSALLNLK